jgi:hypothetical protein
MAIWQPVGQPFRNRLHGLQLANSASDRRAAHQLVTSPGKRL